MRENHSYDVAGGVYLKCQDAQSSEHQCGSVILEKMRPRQPLRPVLSDLIGAYKVADGVRGSLVWIVTILASNR